MTDGSAARFRIRTADGGERPVASVEALTGLVETGEVTPDTLLHDAGTGQWARAGDVPVLRFLVEELRREGRAPEAWAAMPEETASAPAPPPKDAGLPMLDAAEGERGEPAAEEESVAEEEELEVLPFTPDPFEMHLPLSPREREAPDSPAGPAERPPVSESPPEPGAEPELEPESRPSEPEDIPLGVPLHDWMASSAGARAPEPDPFEDPEGEWEDWLPPEDVKGGDAPEPPTRRGATPVRRTRQRWMAGALGAGVVLVLAFAFLLVSARDGTPGPDPSAASSPAGPAEPDPGAGDPPPPLSADEAGVAAVSAEMSRVFDLLVDSLRIEAGLPPAPPREWLSGYYLARASEFEQVPEFWEAYRALATDLRERDRALFTEALDRALEEVDEEVLPADRRPGARRHLADRYPHVRETHEERYTQLAGAAEAAVALHRFLVEHQERIIYTPALGRGVSADPILEAVPATPEVRREMERHLDRVFEALDRSRRGGPPSMEGLRAELFQRFGEPV
jgi:hypothetical protein